MIDRAAYPHYCVLGIIGDGRTAPSIGAREAPPAPLPNVDRLARRPGSPHDKPDDPANRHRCGATRQAALA